MEKKEKQKGVTLIALVITIIVLIILAGITISLIVGENGIISRAQEAGSETKKSQEKEAISLAILNSQIQDKNYGMKVNKEMLEQDLKTQLGEKVDFTITAYNDISFFVNFIQSNNKYYIDYDGTMIEKENMIAINSAEDLKKFRDEVNSGNSYDGKLVYLTNDINLDINEEWEPIGLYLNNMPFKGMFDGYEHKIDYIRLDTANYKNQGLFGAVVEAKIKNLGIGANCIITGTSDKTGAIVGFLYQKSEIWNCYNMSNISCNNLEVGGIIGTTNLNCKIYNCYNTGNITGQTNVAGIIGNNLTGDVYQCYNTRNNYRNTRENWRNSWK